MMVSIRPALSVDSRPLGAIDDETQPYPATAHFGVLAPAGLLARRLLGRILTPSSCCPHRGFRACRCASALPAAPQFYD